MPCCSFLFFFLFSLGYTASRAIRIGGKVFWVFPPEQQVSILLVEPLGDTINEAFRLNGKSQSMLCFFEKIKEFSGLWVWL